MSHSKPFVYLCLVGLFSFISYDMVRRPALALYVESLDAGPFYVGLIVSISTLTGVFLKLPMGVLSDVVNRQKLMIGGVLAFALPPFIYPFISDLWSLGLLRLFHGLATAMFTPLALAMVAELFRERRGEAFGWYTAAAQGGGLIGPMIGGMLVFQYGFSLTFFFAGLFGLFAIVFYLRIPHPSSTTGAPVTSFVTVWNDVAEGLRRVCHSPPIIMASIVEAGKMIGNGTLMAFLPLYGLSIGLNAAEIGLLFGVQALTSFVAKPFMGRISDRGARQPLICMGLSLCGVMVIFIPQSEAYALLLLLAGAFGFGEAVVTSSTTALVADLSEGKNLGAGMGLRGTIMDMGHAGGPLLAGWLIQLLGYGTGFLCIGLILCLTAGFFGVMMIGIKKQAVL